MEDILDKSLVSDPTICNLLLRVGTGRLDVAVYSVVHDNSLIYRSVSLDPAASDMLKAVEDTVYDNPLLLSDFRRIYCLLETDRTMVVPLEADDPALCRNMFKAVHPDFAGEVLESSTSTRNARILYGPDEALIGFIRRTFHGVTIDSHLSPLCRYFASKPGRGNSRRVICNFRREAVDVVILDGNMLMLANTFRYNSPMDAVYYILASWKSLGLDVHTDELLLAGDQGVREEIVPTLRRFLARVMPVIFPPQMFRAGRESMRAPFDLIVTPLCE